MPTVHFMDHAGASQTVASLQGGALVSLCDAIDSPVPFHCRRGRCGTCRIEVLTGGDELLPAQPAERRVLEMLGLSAEGHRLACQAQMRPGLASLRLRPLGRRPHRPGSFRVPIVHGPGACAMHVRAQDSGATEMRISGATELTAGSLLLFDFQPPAAAQPGQVLGRVLGIESTALAGDGLQRSLVAIELLEHDDFFASLFAPVTELAPAPRTGAMSPGPAGTSPPAAASVSTA